MRKTSQDGTDSTSVTSGIDNELKKPGTSTNKIKKSSIKRKVPNFSHDSDDAIIEPLLQAEKEHSVNINNSAKYVLNRPKTDCLYERETKVLENPKVSIPVSIANNVTNNIISENPSPSSLLSETPPIYNHMNVNVFSGNDLTNLAMSIGHPILIEIDGCKPVGIGPNPLIFTTAKIHTDTKTKLMEPFQVTPMPILSTVEGNVVKSGVIYENEKRYGILHTNKHDVTKNVGNKSENKSEHANFNDLTHVKVSPIEALSNSIQMNNQQNIKKELDTQDSFEKSAKLFSKDQKVSLKATNANGVDQKSSIPKVTSVDTVTTKVKLPTAMACKANGVFVSDTSKQLIGTEAKSVTSDKNNSDKSKGISANEKINSDKIPQPYASSSKQNNKSNINTVQIDKVDNTKSFSTSSKKLQRQKNAAVEEIKEINYKEFNNIPTGKNSATLDKGVSTPLDLKSDNATTYKISTPMTVTTKGTTPILPSGIPSKSLNSSTTNPPISKSSVITGTSAPINSKPVIETVKTKPAPTRIPEPSIKSATKSPVTVTSTTSSMTSTTSTAKSTKLADDRSKLNNTELTTTSSVTSTLPLYIVSTSKTKIGSSATPSISTVTKKTLDQKPVTEVVNTNGKSGKLLMSTSSSQSNQSSSKPKNTSMSMLVQKEDDRA